MVYKELFELNIFHEYYENKACPDFSIEPTKECNKILRGHRLIVKNKVNGIVVIFPVNSDKKPWIDLASNLQFSFILKLKNKDFIDFTDAKDIGEFNKIVQVKCPPNDINCKSFDNSIYQYSNQDNSHEELGLNKTTIKLSDRKLPRGQNIFGIIDIYNKNLMPESEYKISFKAKQQKWHYYLVVDRVTNGDKFSIKDESNREVKITFSSKNAETTQEKRIFSALKQKFPKSEQYLFISESEITCQELGREKIQLLKIKNSQDTKLIEHLPNPPNSNGTQVINALKHL